jgi:hypothetical protein
VSLVKLLRGLVALVVIDRSSGSIQIGNPKRTAASHRNHSASAASIRQPRLFMCFLLSGFT